LSGGGGWGLLMWKPKVPGEPDNGVARAVLPAAGGLRPARRPYGAPVLVNWGTLHELTSKVGRTGHQDGGSIKNKTKTR